MKKHWFGLLILIALILGLVDCNPVSSEPPQRILIWHGWGEDESQGLIRLVDDYRASNPKVTVIVSAIPADDLYNQYTSQASLGLGPDLLMGPSDWLLDLIEAGLIQDLNQLQKVSVETSRYLSVALETLRYGNGLYGLPFSLDTNVLYYNEEIINGDPPTTLSELFVQVTEDSNRAALNTSFDKSFWGVKAFGGQLLDKDNPEQVVLNQGGFANWLAWLKRAQDEPNFFLDTDSDILFRLFIEEEVVYYVSGAKDISRLREELNVDAVRAVPLPEGPFGPSGPFLRTEALMFNTYSSEDQTMLALELATFLTAEPQQKRLARFEQPRVPANSRVRLNPQVYPVISSFLTQARTAVPMPNHIRMKTLAQLGNAAYAQSLSGVLSVNEAAQTLTEQANQQIGSVAITPSPETGLSIETCELEGTLNIWHRWEDAHANALEEIGRNFSLRCPSVFVSFQNMESEVLRQQYEEMVVRGRGPDLLLGSSGWIPLLVEEGLIHSLDDLVESDLLQQYVPTAQEVLQLNQRIYGLPVSMDLMGLYYKADQVNDPPRRIGDLLQHVTSSRRLILPIDFYMAFWGLTAFGGITFDDNYQPIPNETGFEAWLEWLKMAQQRSGVVLILSDYSAALNRFLADDAAYFVGYASSLPFLKEEIEHLQVIPLPAEVNKANPLLIAEGFMFNPNSNDYQRSLAFEFAKYATGVESQRLLMDQADDLPTNVNVIVESDQYPAIDGFLEQAKETSVMPNFPEAELLLQMGDTVYIEALNGTAQSEELVSNFSESLPDVMDDDPRTRPELQLTCGEGELLLWHSLDNVEIVAFNQLIEDFASYCSNVQIKTEFVSPDSLFDRLKAVQQNGTGPEIIWTSHTQIMRLREAGLIKDITSFVEGATLIDDYLPHMLDTMRLGKQLYGLPQTAHVMTLYYRPDLVEMLPRTLADLSAAATAKTSVAIHIGFYESFWGISAFGGQLLDEVGQPALNQNNAWTNWLNWLLEADENENILFDQDVQTLEQRFINGELAYLTAESESLTRLQRAMGEERVDVMLLPSGPEEIAQPLLLIEGFLFSSKANEAQIDLALSFAQFLAWPSSQTLLMNQANMIPLNPNVKFVDQPTIATLQKQIQTATIFPPELRPSTLETGDRLYWEVLAGQLEPQSAIDQFRLAVREEISSNGEENGN